VSKYSGRCDAYDSLIMIHEYTDEELRDNVKIYIGYNTEPLPIKSKKELIPYYAHLVGCAFYNNEEKKSIIYLSSESCTDQEEKDSLAFKLKRVLTIYNRCKRKKIEFNIEEVVKELSWDGWDDHIYREIANRVKENGNKANTDGIHLKIHEYYRRELVKEMIANGLNPAEYGYERFLEGAAKEVIENENIKK
jgi:hypothetical protein